MCKSSVDVEKNALTEQKKKMQQKSTNDGEGKKVDSEEKCGK